jgi:hypothetical protein
MTQEMLDGARLLAEVGKHVYLVVLNVSWPKMSYTICDAIVEIDGAAANGEKLEVAERFRNNPNWKLMPEPWKKRFGALENRARTAVSKSSVAFATKGMALLPIAKAADVFTKLRGIRDEMTTAIGEFTMAYSQIMTDLEEELGPVLYDKASRKLPTTADIQNTAGIRWSIMPLGGGTHLSVTVDAVRRARWTLMTAGQGNEAVEIAEFEAALDTLTQLVVELSNPVNRLGEESAMELIDEARSQFNVLAQQMVEDMATEPRRVLTEAINHLLEALETGKTIRSGTLGAIERAFELVHGFSFMADNELLEHMRECEVTLNRVSVQDLNASREIGSQLAGALTKVRDQAANSVAATNASRQFRRITLKPAQKNKVAAPAAV